MLKIYGGRVVTDTLSNKNVYVEDGKIVAVTEEELPFDEAIDAEGNYVSAGFIDTHLHGGGGGDFMDGSEEAIRTAADLHLKHGSTTILPSTIAASPDETVKAVKLMEKIALESEYTNIYGAYLEGPYFSKGQAGAQDPRYITPPIKEDYERIIKECGSFIKKVAFAPELDGSLEFCSFLSDNGIIPVAAHTDATIDDIKAARDRGLHMVAHLYSSMSTITRRKGYRILGVVESAYLFDDIYAEVIADGHHLPFDLLKLIYKIKGSDKICLVTDAMRGAGQKEGKSVLGKLDTGLECIIENGVALLPDRSSFAGSVATTDRLVRVMKNEVGIDIVEVVKMMTETPAKAHGMANKGKLDTGFDADVVIFDEDVNIKKVILKGKII